MLKSKKYLIALTLTLGASVMSTSHVFAKSSINVTRLAGQDRYGISNAIISQGWSHSDYAVLVNSQNFPDAITASPLAKKYNAPILLTDTDSLTPSTQQELQKLGVKNVIIVGGPGVVSSNVASSLQSMNISPLKSLTNLKSLTIYGDNISDISPLKGLTNLESLSIGSNNLSDLSQIQGLTNLKSLDVSYDTIADTAVITKLTNLQTLDISCTYIEDISGLKTLTNLKSLNLTSLGLKDSMVQTLQTELPNCKMSDLH